MIKNISKKTIIIIIAIVLLVGLGIGGYFYGSNLKKPETAIETKAPEEVKDTTEKITESATSGVLPSIGTNPLENKPDVNPADKANPFKNIKTNPFE
ncbi:MAG: hypothetical protein AAB404_03210 [Patescibacteria group bacterium]